MYVHLPHDRDIPRRGIHLRGIKSYLNANTYAWMFKVALFVLGKIGNTQMFINIIEQIVVYSYNDSIQQWKGRNYSYIHDSQKYHNPLKKPKAKDYI